MRVPIQLDLGQVYTKLIAHVQMQYECIIFLFVSFTLCLVRTEAVGISHKKTMTHQRCGPQFWFTHGF